MANNLSRDFSSGSVLLKRARHCLCNLRKLARTEVRSAPARRPLWPFSPLSYRHLEDPVSHVTPPIQIGEWQVQKGRVLAEGGFERAVGEVVVEAVVALQRCLLRPRLRIFLRPRLCIRCGENGARGGCRRGWPS